MGRRNVVITRQAGYSAPSVETAQSLDDALSMCADADEVFVIGGGENRENKLRSFGYIE